jgi:TPR repeat protein
MYGGDGVAKDEVQGRVWMKKAAALGDRANMWLADHA